MDIKKKYRLKKDVVSHFKPFEVYGTAGTEVIILHDHFDMMIVQDDTGNNFHSRTDNLAELSEPVEKQATVKPIEQTKLPGVAKKRRQLQLYKQTCFDL